MTIWPSGEHKTESDKRLCNRSTGGRWGDHWMVYEVQLCKLVKLIKNGDMNIGADVATTRGTRTNDWVDSDAPSDGNTRIIWNVSATKDGHFIQNQSLLKNGIVKEFYVYVGKGRVDFTCRLSVPDKVSEFIDGDWVGFKDNDCLDVKGFAYVLRQVKLRIERKFRVIYTRTQVAIQILSACDELEVKHRDMLKKHKIDSVKSLTLNELEDYLSRIGFNECTSTRSRMHRALARGPEVRDLIQEHEDERCRQS